MPGPNWARESRLGHGSDCQSSSMRSKASAAARSLYRAGRENSAYRRLVLVQRMLVQVVVRQVTFPNPE